MTKCKFIFDQVKTIYVVFADETSLWWLRFLKKGFRHCYFLVRLDNGMTWVEFNPMSNQIFLNVYQFLDNFEYIDFIKNSSNVTVCCVNVENVGLKTAPIGLFTCVEAVKRVLGIHSVFTITPYQLYKKIKGCRKKVLT